MVILKQFNVVQLLFKFVGFAPISLSTENKKLWKCYNLLPVILTPFFNLCISLYIYFYPIFDPSVQIHGVINCIAIICLWLTVVSGNYQCHFYKSIYRNINYEIQEIEKNAKKNFSLEFTMKLTRECSRKIYLLLILFVVSQGILLYEVYIVSGFMSAWSSLFTTILWSKSPIGIMHMVLYCDCISMCLKELNLKLKNSSTFFYWTSKIEFLKNMKTMHMDVLKVVLQINTFFGWNILFIVINLSCYITILQYWLFISLHHQVDALGITGRFRLFGQ